MPNDQKIRQIVQEEIRKNNNSSRFNVNPISQIKLNNLNVSASPASVITYIGFIPYDGGTDPTLKYLLPNGWTVTHPSDGNYLITHNLGTQLYSIVITPAQSTNQPVFPFVDPFSNSVDISFIETFGVSPSFQDTSFNFVLVQINNKVAAFPKYDIRNPLSFGNI